MNLSEIFFLAWQLLIGSDTDNIFYTVYLLCHGNKVNGILDFITRLRNLKKISNI